MHYYLGPHHWTAKGPSPITEHFPNIVGGDILNDMVLNVSQRNLDLGYLYL